MGLKNPSLDVERDRIEKLKCFEKEAYQEGYKQVAGIDEVGRGCIAGPVAAAAVILPRDFFLAGVNDSKLLSEKKRLKMVVEIKREALAWSVVMISPQRIDQQNILLVTKEAMRTAVNELLPVPDFLLIDAVKIPDINIRQYPIIRGDSLSISIACASILAKVERDQSMQAYDSMYPGYGFARHKGYATREHIIALDNIGVSPIHRCSFEPVKSILGGAYGAQPNLFK
ncbi:MAG: ribonuclease HII [Firmicutes bacterium HGW-Firmicutes-15]|nr:MAG: ribonuclease HII [Firmicutes bacterium HGW-Firmicutes-15]